MTVCMICYIWIADHQGGQVDFNLTAIPALVNYSILCQGEQAL